MSCFFGGGLGWGRGAGGGGDRVKKPRIGSPKETSEPPDTKTHVKDALRARSVK